MWPQHRSHSAYPREVAAFGKLPWAGDFLQVGHPPGKEEFLEWLEQGIAIGSQRDTPWKTAFEEGAQKGFLFPCSNQGIIVGVMGPSRDLVGRRFPFVTYASLAGDSLDAAPHVAPLMLGNFLHAAGTQVLSLQAQETDVAQAVSLLPFPEVDSLLAHEEGYRSWAQGELLRNAGKAIFGPDWRDRLAYALYMTWEALQPFEGQESPPTPLSIRYALGAGLSGAAVFWLQLVRLCAGWRNKVPCAVWSFEPECPSLTVQLGPNSAHTFADVWEPEPSNENLCNLLEAGASRGELLEASRPDLAQLIRQESTTVAQLLHAIRPA